MIPLLNKTKKTKANSLVKKTAGQLIRIKQELYKLNKGKKRNKSF